MGGTQMSWHDVSGQVDIELGYGITLAVDFDARGNVDDDMQGDHNVINGLHEFIAVTDVRITITGIGIRGERPDVELLEAITRDTYNKLTEECREYAEQLIEEEATT
jgi:hypothetical protein